MGRVWLSRCRLGCPVAGVCRNPRVGLAVAIGGWLYRESSLGQYDDDVCRQAAAERGYIPHIPDSTQLVPALGDPQHHPPRRWVMEVGHAWFNRFRGVLIRWAKSAESYLGFVQLAACLIVARKLLTFEFQHFCPAQSPQTSARAR